MQTILVRESEVDNPEYRAAVAAGTNRRGIPTGIKVPPGTIISRPDAWKLVRNGMGVPGDKECREAAGMEEDAIQAAVEAARLLDESVGFDFENGKLIFESDPAFIGEKPDVESDVDDLLYLIRVDSEADKKARAEQARKEKEVADKKKKES